MASKMTSGPAASQSEATLATFGSDVGRRLAQAEMLLAVSQEAAAIEDLDEMLRFLVKKATTEIGAERGSVFLHDPETQELYSRVALGNRNREIRVLDTSGVAGHVFRSGIGEIVDDAYGDERFNHTIDKQTGFKTRNLLCAPIRTVKNEIIGVAQILNKKDGEFVKGDLLLLEAIATQASVTLQNIQFAERMNKLREKELGFLDAVAGMSSELDLGALLQKVMKEVTGMLDADRSTLFLNDEKTNELFSRIAQGASVGEIRLPNHMGIAGAVFTSGDTINIPYAYADLRFNPAFDRKTGYFTRSILCVPIINKDGKTIGVTQVLNKKGGPFTEEDETRLKAFTGQLSIALENAKLFDDVQNMKNYNESMLESMSNGVITLDDESRIITCNAAGVRILKTTAKDILGKPADEFFAGPNAWLAERIHGVLADQDQDLLVDAEIVFDDHTVSANLHILPLLGNQNEPLGTMMMIEDITAEKRVKSTMARYMDPGLLDKLLAEGQDVLSGQSTDATILFSDIRSFTTLSESLGAQGTVAMLNDYFTLMVDCIQSEEGMLDKFIGDAIMAAFGLPVPHDDDPDRAVRSAISMMKQLNNYNQSRAELGQDPINIGIGINTGNVVSGNIGSPKRVDYTVIGDGVNLASRLESACKQYGTNILISEGTFEALHATYRTREIDRVIVKGKTTPVTVYEVLDFHNEETFPSIQQALAEFRGGLEYYRAAKWDAAIDAFKGVLALRANDTASNMYIERCEALKLHPPQGEWTGVWTMTKK